MTEFTPKPARGYKWADAEPGNLLAVRHGAGSERLVSAKAAEVLAELMASYPWLEEVDGVVLDTLVRAKARHDLLADYIDRVIEGTAEAYPRKGRPTTGIEAVPDVVWQQVSREARTVLDAASRLGFTPRDRAELFRDAGMAAHYGGERVAQLGERGSQIRARRLREVGESA